MPEDLPPQTETIRLRADGGVLYATLDAPPLNMIGPELVRDLVRLIGYLSNPTPFQVVVFDSADPDFFIAHVDMTKVPEYTAEAAKAGGPGDASLGMLYQRLSRLPVVTIAKLRGRARGGGSEFLLACDIRFASRENAILSQFEVGLGAPPGAGAVERLTRLLGSARAVEVLVGGEDFTADVAERYGWINRALPDDELDTFVERFARRVAGFPRDAITVIKAAVTRISGPSDEEIRAAAVVFQHLIREGSFAARAAWLIEQGLQTHGPTERELGDVLADITPNLP